MKLVFACALLQGLLGAAVIYGAHRALYSSTYHHYYQDGSWTDGHELATDDLLGWEYERPMRELALSIYEFWLRDYDARCGGSSGSRRRYGSVYRKRRTAKGPFWPRYYYTSAPPPPTTAERADASKEAADCAADALMSHQWQSATDVGRYATLGAIWLAGCYGATLAATALTALLPVAYRCLQWFQPRVSAALGAGADNRPAQRRAEKAKRYKMCTVFTLAVAAMFTIVMVACAGQYYHYYKLLPKATWQLWASGLPGLCLLAAYVLLAAGALPHLCTGLLCLHVPMAAVSMCISGVMAASSAAFYALLAGRLGRQELSAIDWMRPWALLFAIVLSMAALTLLLGALATVDQLVAEMGGCKRPDAVESQPPVPGGERVGASKSSSATLPQVKEKLAQIATATKGLLAVLFAGGTAQRAHSAEAEGRSNLVVNMHTEHGDQCEGQAPVESDVNQGNAIGVGVNDNVV